MEMNIIVLTNEYSLAEQNGVYFLNFGILKLQVPATVKIRFEDIYASTFNLRSTCGCTVAEKIAIDSKTIEYTITYNASTLGRFDKTLVITDREKRAELKLIGITTQ